MPKINSTIIDYDVVDSKPVFLHFHIFKNAGTTLEWIFKKKFSENAISLDTDDPDGILSNDNVITELEKNPRIKAISSHQIRFPIPHYENFKFIPILFIRHPIDRAFSIYYFQRKRTDVDRPGISKAKKLSMNDYIRWNLKIKKFKPMKNFQVLFLSKMDVKSDVDENNLATAIENMKSCPIIGVVDRFDESLVLAEEILKKYFLDFDLSYLKRNVSKERKENLTQRIKEGKELIDENVWNQLLKENELDMRLYEKTNEELDKRLKNIINLNEKLMDFQNRCKKLQL